jgi:ribonuclease HI
MMELTAAEDLPPRRARARSKFNILYCYGDVSGSGFGWCIDFGGGVRYELGEWCELIQEATSNYWELRNLVNAMVLAVQEGRLEGCEVFLYTDNQTAEGAYCKGTAKRQSLFELIVILYKFANVI